MAVELSPREIRAYYYARFPQLKQSGGGELRGPCPVHHGERDSFAVNLETGLCQCFSECGKGWDPIALEETLNNTDFKTALREVERIVGRTHSNGHGRNGSGNAAILGPIVATYDYVDRDGTLLFQVTRHEPPKDFRQRRRDDHGDWAWGRGDGTPVLYRLPVVLASDVVYVAEGEKGVEALERLGLVATCSPGGASKPGQKPKWRPEYSESLRGKTVAILPDNDEPGLAHARAAAQSLLGIAARVRLVELPGLGPVLKDHGLDIFDWIGSGGTREELEALAAEAPDFCPTVVTEHAKKPKRVAPEVYTVTDLLNLDVPAPAMLIEGLIPLRGASLIVGAAKSGKTLLAVQAAIAVASGAALFGQYRVLTQGPALILEQDDSAGAASVKAILQRSTVPVEGIPLYLAPRVPYQFGVELIEWVEGQITSRSLVMVVLDSYTSLRGSRGSGVDIVKAEQNDLMLLDCLAKRTGCAIVILHHSSKGSAALDWSEKAAGTFAMSAATESQLFISRFADLDGAAPERLVRVRGRHSEDLEMVLRFRKDSLDYEHVLEGGAAVLYPLILQIRAEVGEQKFSPKDLSHATGLSIATAHRQITRLYRANALQKRGYGEYALVV